MTDAPKSEAELPDDSFEIDTSEITNPVLAQWIRATLEYNRLHGMYFDDALRAQRGLDRPY